MDLPELTLDHFASPREIRVEGPPLKTYLSEHESVYFEWAYGRMENGKWSEWSVGYQSDAGFAVVTGSGRMNVSRSDVRLFLSPSFERDYASEAQAPEGLRSWIREHGSVHAAEYRLEAGRVYFALLHEDHYYLPSPGGPPKARSRKVLWISDRPFSEGKPVVQITPAYHGWTY